mgnify:CR=1 FL=1
MSKRGFRAKVSPDTAEISTVPTLEGFDAGRRRFLSRLGVALLGAGTVAAGISGCGDRIVNTQPDQGVPPPGAAPMPDAKVDKLQQLPDVGLSGAAPMPDARIKRDGHIIDGEPPMPDARIEQDHMLSGAAPVPDAAVDMGYGPPGEAPMPDARVDKP